MNAGVTHRTSAETPAAAAERAGTAPCALAPPALLGANDSKNGNLLLDTVHTPLVLAARESAIARRPPRLGLIHHSDRGCQYVETTYRALLHDQGFTQSMSGAGNCRDNAAMESFWSTLKTDAELSVVVPPDRRHAELAVFDYIETFYNRARRHSSLGYLSPVASENQQIQDITAD